MDEHSEYLELLRLFRMELERAIELGASLPDELDVFSVMVTDKDREVAESLMKRVLDGEVGSVSEQAALAGAGMGFDRKAKDSDVSKDPFEVLRKQAQEKLSRKTGGEDEDGQEGQDS